MYKYITTFIIILVASFILLGLGRQIADAIQSSRRLDNEADEVNKLQQQNRQLKDKLTQVQQPDFVEQVARDKLNMSKAGETVVVVPDQTITKIIAAQTPPAEVKIPYWQGWVKLFIH
jgi:cell division protein FtsB